MNPFRYVLAGVLCLLLCPALAQEMADDPPDIAKQLNNLYQSHVVAFRALFPLGETCRSICSTQR